MFCRKSRADKVALQAQVDSLQAQVDSFAAEKTTFDARVHRDMNRLYATASKATYIVRHCAIRCPVSQVFLRRPAVLMNERFGVMEVDGLSVLHSRVECLHCFQDSAVEPWVRQHKTCPQCRAPVNNVVHLRGLGHDMSMPELEGVYNFDPVNVEEDVEPDPDQEQQAAQEPAQEPEPDRAEDGLDRQDAQWQDIEFEQGGHEQMDW